MIMQDPDLYMRGYHYLLTCTYNLSNVDKFNQYLDELSTFRKNNYHKFTPNSKITSFLYVHHGRLNSHYLNRTFKQGVDILPKTFRRLALYKNKLDPHRVMVFHFKIAWMYLMAGIPGKAVDYINEIINSEVGALREDIQTYARLLFLMAHYDLGNEGIMGYLVSQAKSHFDKSHQINKLQKATLQFFQTLVNTPQYERKDVMKSFNKTLDELRKDGYEKRAFLYLDIPLWLDAKLKK